MPSKAAPIALVAAAGACGGHAAFSMAFPAAAPPRAQQAGSSAAAAARSAPAQQSSWMLGGASAGAVAAAAVVSVRRQKRSGKVALKAALEGVDCKTAFLFPGQGAQSVGMCKDLVEECPAAKDLFVQASDILGYDLLDRCVSGPKEVLDTTTVSQPAIFVASMGAVEKLKQEQGAEIVDEATVAMGLSLGEYSALCFSGALAFEDGVRITKARGEAMQAAADSAPSGMVSVIGLDSAKTEALCEKASEESGKKVQIANYLCKGNYTVSGDKEACAKLVEIAKPEFKARMAVPLAVAGAFHTDFMAPAVGSLKDALAAADFKSPRIPVVSNVDALPHSSPDEIREILARQVTAPVMWEQQMQAMVASGFEKGYELGPGKVISGILKRIDKAAAGNVTNFSV